MAASASLSSTAGTLAVQRPQSLASTSSVFHSVQLPASKHGLASLATTRRSRAPKRSIHRTTSGLLVACCNSWRSVLAMATLTESAPTSSKLQERGPVVVVDNYDSFTYNLCQYLGNLGCEYVVYRNDDLSVAELERLKPRGLLISPGPGTPDDSGISLEVVKTLGPQMPLFGVCMGLQCIGQAFGGDIVRAPQGVMHGKTSLVYHNQEDVELGLLAGLPSPFTACRYHSLVISKETFPESELEITAWTVDGLIMGARHKRYPYLEGVQFHPESVITSNGLDIVRNFLKTIDQFWAQ